MQRKQPKLFITIRYPRRQPGICFHSKVPDARKHNHCLQLAPLFAAMQRETPTYKKFTPAEDFK